MIILLVLRSEVLEFDLNEDQDLMSAFKALPILGSKKGFPKAYYDFVKCLLAINFELSMDEIGAFTIQSIGRNAKQTIFQLID